jgi:phage shock protein A
MPGLRGRLSTLMKAKTSAALDRAEDPAQTLDYSYEKQLELMADVKNGITEVASSRKRLQNQQASLREQVVKFDGQARQALAAGNDDLSRAAPERKQAVGDEIGLIDAQVAGLEGQQEQLKDSQRTRQARLDSMRSGPRRRSSRPSIQRRRPRCRCRRRSRASAARWAMSVRRRSARSGRPRT